MPIETMIPSWPKERDLARYVEFTNINFDTDLAANEIWIDIGCRTGKALDEARHKYHAKLIGINAHKIEVLPGSQSIYTVIPNDISVYTAYRNKAKLVTDIHGAVSYCENPLEALIYEACLLKENAKAVIVTMEKRMYTPHQNILEQITRFFNEVMKKKIIFEPFTSYSDNTKTPIKTIRITITNDAPVNNLSLEELFAQAQKTIGKMGKNQIIAQATDGSAKIWQVIYQ